MTTDGDALNVARWTKFGKDRLYVSAADGTKVGFLDLVTGQRTVTAPAYEAAFHATVDAHPCAEVSAAQAPSSLTDSSSDDVLPAPGSGAAANPQTRGTGRQDSWIDLSLNVPGQAAHEVADAEWEALKERSKLRAYGSRLLGIKTDERNWRVGADGEVTVGARLERLTSHGWHVLHAVPVGDRGSDIDHVLVGPGGVWTINTKNHPGGKVWVSSSTVLVNGVRQPYLRNSRFEAARASRLLTAAVGFGVEVRPALVLLTGTIVPDVTVRSRPDDVAILDRMDIPRAFRRTERVLLPAAVEAVFEVARRSTTWQR